MVCGKGSGGGEPLRVRPGRVLSEDQGLSEPLRPEAPHDGVSLWIVVDPRRQPRIREDLPVDKLQVVDDVGAGGAVHPAARVAEEVVRPRVHTESEGEVDGIDREEFGQEDAGDCSIPQTGVEFLIRPSVRGATPGSDQAIVPVVATHLRIEAVVGNAVHEDLVNQRLIHATILAEKAHIHCAAHVPLQDCVEVGEEVGHTLLDAVVIDVQIRMRGQRILAQILWAI
mmetsp:Transcript_1856/g.4593  ORF Transcript_1856/g.4593 Transcript_1856/m.4593 type:complete len:227 (+) Transcript_1856:2-682(+)